MARFIGEPPFWRESMAAARPGVKGKVQTVQNGGSWGDAAAAPGASSAVAGCGLEPQPRLFFLRLIHWTNPARLCDILP